MSPKVSRILKISAVSAAGLAVALTVIAYLLPAQFHVERSMEINAPPQAIYPLIASFKSGWVEWTPFGKAKYPDMQVVYSGPDLGVGARQSWDSDDAGDGQITIIKADEQRGVEYDLWVMQESIRLKGALLCDPLPNGRSKVTWSDDIDYSAQNPFWRYMGLFMDGALGKEFEEGLTTLKQKAEARVASASP